MVNLRYHIVSLTAVFLALIIGILMGTTVVSKATVDGLRSNLHRAEVRSEAVHAQNDELTSQLAQHKKFEADVDSAQTEQVLPQAVDGVLTDVPVLIIANSAVDEKTLREVIAALGDGGADVDGTLLIDHSLAPDKLDPSRLAKVLGTSKTENVLSVLSTRLAGVLADAAGSGTNAGASSGSEATTSTSEATGTNATVTTNPEDAANSTTTTIPQAGQPELITELRKAGYVTFRPLTGGSKDATVLESVHAKPGNEYRYVILSGPNPNVPDSAFLDGLVAKLAQTGSVSIVAGSAGTGLTDEDRDRFIGPLLDIKGIDGNISTVDNLESFTGLVSVVYALHEAAGGHFGNFGIGERASAVIPTYRP